MTQFIRFVFILFIIAWATACKEPGHSSGEMAKDTSEAYMEEAGESTITVLPCDSLGMTDFKRNLVREKSTLPDYIKSGIDSIAKNFIEERCSDDSLFCEPIYLKMARVYKADADHLLFSCGYAFEESESVIEEEAASFFVFGIIKNNTITFWDVAEDLMGEIQFELYGAEFGPHKTTIWGETYPYFAKEQGKFRVQIADGKATSVFQCSEE